TNPSNTTATCRCEITLDAPQNFFVQNGGATFLLTSTTLELAGNTLTFNGPGDVTVDDVITDATPSLDQDLLKFDGGTLSLLRANTYDATTEIHNSNLVIGDPGALGAGHLGLHFSTVSATRPMTIPNSFVCGDSSTFGGSNNVTFAGDGD